MVCIRYRSRFSGNPAFSRAEFAIRYHFHIGNHGGDDCGNGRLCRRDRKEVSGKIVKMIQRLWVIVFVRSFIETKLIHVENMLYVG